MERVGRGGSGGGGAAQRLLLSKRCAGAPHPAHARARCLSTRTAIGRHTPARESRESRGGREMMLTFGARARLYDAYFTVIRYSTVLCGVWSGDGGAY
jgi:hypothetical protein